MRPFSHYVGASVLFHLFVLILGIFISELTPLRRPAEMRVTWVKLGGPQGEGEGLPFKKADALPQTTIEEQRQATFEKPPPPKEITPPTPEKTIGAEKKKVVINEKPPPKKPPKTEEKKPEGKPYHEDPRIAQALAKINEDLKTKPVIPEAAQVKEGAEGSPEGSPGGSNSECDAYSSQVKRRIVGNWIRLVGANRPPRPPKIFTAINAYSEVLSTQWVQKSGDYSLDMSALRAIQNSSPFPSPPLNCQAALSGGITVPLRD